MSGLRMTMQRIYRFLGACSCWGAKIRTCEEGPQDLLNAKIFERLEKDGVRISEVKMIFPKKMASSGEIPLSESLPLIHEFNLRLAKLIAETIGKGEFPVAIIGDHSNAVGMWNGVKKSQSPLGLLWIDAHMDAHTPQTTPSGAWHGMPLAALLGFGDPKMAHLLGAKPVLLPEHVAVIGVHSFEKGEMELLQKLKVKIYFIEEVKRRGFATVFQEAIERVSHNVAGFGVSIDMDAIDPEDAPGVGSPEPGGIRAEELLSALPILKKHPQMVGFEIAEYNPTRDVDHKTRELIYQILKGVSR